MIAVSIASLRGQLRAFWRRSWAERWAGARAAVWLVRAHRVLQTRPFPQALLWAERHGAMRAVKSDLVPLSTASTTLRTDLWAIDAVGRRLFPTGPCLPQALVAQIVLQRAGYRATLCIGTRMVSGPAQTPVLEAHAWVENDGRVWMGDLGDLDSYTPLEMGRTPPGARGG